MAQNINDVSRRRLPAGMTAQRNLGKWIAFVLLFLLLIVWIMPVFWTLMTSFKPTQEAKQFFKLRNITPNTWTTENYTYLFGMKGTPVVTWFMNSFIVSVSSAVLVVVITSTSAYAYERLQFKGKETIFWTVFALSMLPGVVNMVPLYQIMAWLKWLNRLPAVILPSVTGVFNIFLVRNFLKGIPKDIDEAARIDGASEFRVYLTIMLPLLRPVLTVVALFAFTGAWNDFMWPAIALQSPERMTLTPGMRNLQQAENGHQVRVMAGSVMAMIPTFLIYLGAQRFFLTGLNVGSGLKE